MAITEEESLIELASLLKGGHDKKIIDEKEMKKFIEAVREKEEEEDSPPVNGAEVMCVYAEDQTKPVKVKKLEGDISIGGKAQLNSRDIELEGTFSGCFTSGGECEVKKEWIEEGKWQDVDEGNDQGEERETLDREKSYMICTEWGGLIYFYTDGQEPAFLTKGDKILYLSRAFLDWLETAEGLKLFPFIDPNDNSEAKKYQTVTIGIGLSFNNGGDNWDVLRDILGWTDDDIREIIRRIYSGQDKDFVYKEERRFLEDPKYKITEKQAKKLLVTAAMRKYMPNLNRTIEENNKKKGKAATYYQEQLEAMFDVSYNQGVSPEKVYDPDSIIPYYLTGNQKGAVNAVTSFGKDRSRRRLNQMKLFFIKSYEFENYNDGSKEFDPLRAELGFKVE